MIGLALAFAIGMVTLVWAVLLMIVLDRLFDRKGD